tara:strand:+ start:16906 stop:17826 length:921 start_codon:yes stop_codon:yes gene_type:complete
MNISKTLIAIPLYNAEEFVERTLDSCLNQTLPSEIWVVDNCSTDRTTDIVRKYQKDNSLIKLIVNDKNYGRVGNWNRCLDLFTESEFQYIKYVFSGDEILPTCIEESERAFSIDDEIGVVAFPYMFINRDGSSSIARHDECPNKLFTPKEITYKNLAEGGLLGAIICNVYAKKAIRNFRFDEANLGKLKFDTEVLEKSKAYYLDKVLANFNLDSHNTFYTMSNFHTYLEFSEVIAKEFLRISKTEMFSDKEKEKIQQKIIINTVNDQLRFMTLRTRISIMLSIILESIKESLRSVKQMLKGIKNGK